MFPCFKPASLKNKTSIGMTSMTHRVERAVLVGTYFLNLILGSGSFMKLPKVQDSWGTGSYSELLLSALEVR